MKRLGLVSKSLRDIRVATYSVALVNILIGFIDILVYPTYKESLADFEMSGVYAGFLGEAESFASPEGFLSAEFFSWIPLLLITIAIIGATGALAGEEGAGTMDLLLAQPISRRRLVLDKLAGLVVSVTIAALLSFPAFLAAKLFVDFPLSNLRILEATVNMLPVTYLFLAIALWGSAALPGRGAAALVAIGVLVVAYFLNALGAAIDFLEIPRKFSPFYWSDASHVLIHGFDWLRAAGLTAVAALFAVLAVVSFERRDISSGAREWTLRGVLWRAMRGRAATIDAEART